MVQIIPAGAEKTPLNLMVYADSGAGKTVFAASVPRVLFIAPEDTGIISAVNLGYKFDKITVKSWSDFVRAYEYCYDNMDELVKKYDWFAIDSITKMQEICLTELVESQAAARKAKDQDPDLPQIQDYQKLYILINRMVLAFNDLPVNVIYTALARNVEDPDGNEFLMPMIGSNKATDYRVAMQVASHMTSYGYFKIEIVEKPAPTEDDPKKTRKVKQRVIFWEDTGAYRGKDRTTRLTPKTVLPGKNALDFVAKVANGVLDRSGEPIVAKPVPAKKAPAKKVAPHSGIPVESGSPAAKVAQKPVPEDKLARNDSDSISAVTDIPPAPKEGASEGIELASVEA
jgi:hypothetical protein